MFGSLSIPELILVVFMALLVVWPVWRVIRFSRSSRAAAALPARPPVGTPATAQRAQPRPLLLRVGAWVSIIAGASLVVAALSAALGISDSLEGLVAWEWWYSFVSMLLGGAALFIVGLGLQQQKNWARPAAVAFWLVVGVFSIARSMLVSVHALGSSFDLGWIPSLALAYWYFYQKRNVVEYYKYLGAGAHA